MKQMNHDNRKIKKTGAFALGTTARLVILTLIIFATIRYATLGYSYGYQIFAQKAQSEGQNAKTVTVTVEEGQSVKQIAKMLQEKGLIHDARLFRLQEYFSDYHKKLKPGVYELNTAMKPEEMMAKMSETENKDAAGSSSGLGTTDQNTETAGQDEEWQGDEGDHSDDASKGMQDNGD
ncbi:MAG: endolytic transglycosylase MltG [Lachnospiraceae bacterium]|jgi:hypothetical protein|nr:endolytic transglycosylase MltG [Lachnospiraceae bacterium]MBF1004779.1 endolytic transglycosylase MltG [Lachnospiraceae bacterium]MBF1016669.1 endolytic transglycosylase MltG [Lachnospiraceae bacterium]